MDAQDLVEDAAEARHRATGVTPKNHQVCSNTRGALHDEEDTGGLEQHCILSERLVSLLRGG
jgi:hypothetical protein